MADENYKRKLTAILSADVAGYSRLMGDDETATVSTLKSHRKLISEKVHTFKGGLSIPLAIIFCLNLEASWMRLSVLLQSRKGSERKMTNCQKIAKWS